MDLQPIRCAGCGADVEPDLHAMLDGVLHCAHCGAALAPPPAMVFDVRLESYAPARMMEVSTALAGCMGQKHAVASVYRDFVKPAPRLVRCGAGAAEAADFRRKLEAAGAKVTVSPCPGRHP